MRQAAGKRMAGFGEKDGDTCHWPRRERDRVVLRNCRCRSGLIAAEGAASGEDAMAAVRRVARLARKAEHVAKRVELRRGGVAGSGEARREELDEQKDEREMRRPPTRCLAKCRHACDRPILRTRR